MSVPPGILDEDMSRRGTSPVLIIGRGKQMATLTSALAAVRQGGPAAVLVGGKAGVGTVSSGTGAPEPGADWP
jgi:hypothetical protein